MAPIVSVPSPASSIPFRSVSPFRSTSMSGDAARAFMTLISVWPPASARAPSLAASRLSASATDAGFAYSTSRSSTGAILRSAGWGLQQAFDIWSVDGRPFVQRDGRPDDRAEEHEPDDRRERHHESHLGEREEDGDRREAQRLVRAPPGSRRARRDAGGDEEDRGAGRHPEEPGRKGGE